MLSNSLSSVVALGNSFSRSTIIQQVITKCRSSGIRLKISWVRGHSRVVGNERADRLAVEAHRRPLIYDNCKFPKSYIKKRLRRS